MSCQNLQFCCPNCLNPTGFKPAKLQKRAVWRSVLLTILHYMVNKSSLLRNYFLAFSRLKNTLELLNFQNTKYSRPERIDFSCLLCFSTIQSSIQSNTFFKKSVYRLLFTQNLHFQLMKIRT